MELTTRRPGQPFSAQEHRELFELYRAGHNPTEIARRLGCSRTTVYNVIGRVLLASRRVSHSELRLALEERERISRGLAAGESARAIARALGRAPSTVSRELAANGGRHAYRAANAHRRALERRARPKPTRLSCSRRLRAEVERGLRRRRSPEQISARLRLDYPDCEEMRISHETIYQSLYVQSRGELRRQLARNLRSGRARRKPHAGGPERRGKIREMVPISARPPEVEDRAVPGHWEGDLLVGRQNRSFVATLVERHTRYVMLARLGADRSTERVIAVLKERIAELPKHLVLSLTWDQGNELADHARFSVETGIRSLPLRPAGSRPDRRRAQRPSSSDPRLVDAS